MKTLTIIILILCCVTCDLIPTTLTVRNKSRWTIMFYLDNNYKDVISSDDSETYDVESGSHSVRAETTDSLTLVDQSITIKSGKNGIWTVYGKLQSNIEQNE